jgi:hypothetical protein
MKVALPRDASANRFRWIRRIPFVFLTTLLLGFVALIESPRSAYASPSLSFVSGGGDCGDVSSLFGAGIDFEDGEEVTCEADGEASNCGTVCVLWFGTSYVRANGETCTYDACKVLDEGKVDCVYRCKKGSGGAS